MKITTIIFISIIAASSSIPVEINDNYVVVKKELQVPENPELWIFNDENIILNKGRKFSGGYPATDTQFPWTGRMTVWETASSGWVYASTLISERWCLGVRSAVAGEVFETVQIRMGSAYSGNLISFLVDLIIWQDSPTGTDHPNIALFRLSQNVPISSVIKTIQLPARSQQYLTFEGYSLTASGWGSDVSRMSWAHFQVLARSRCPNIIPSEICSRPPSGSNEIGFSSGDSGGPSVIYDYGIPTVIGINVGSTWTGAAFDGMKSTTVGMFLNFISVNTGIPIRD